MRRMVVHAVTHMAAERVVADGVQGFWGQEEQRWDGEHEEEKLELHLHGTQ